MLNLSTYSCSYIRKCDSFDSTSGCSKTCEIELVDSRITTETQPSGFQHCLRKNYFTTYILGICLLYNNIAKGIYIRCSAATQTCSGLAPSSSARPAAAIEQATPTSP